MLCDSLPVEIVAHVISQLDIQPDLVGIENVPDYKLNLHFYDPLILEIKLDIIFKQYPHTER